MSRPRWIGSAASMPRTFRRRQDLVVVVEQAYEVLEAAATKPDLVLLMLAD